MKGVRPGFYFYFFVLPFGDALFMVKDKKRKTCEEVYFFVSVFLQLIISAESLT